MFNELYMKYFKCFTEQTLPLRPLTVLAGLNSSGKSSVLQALRILEDGKLLTGHGDLTEITSVNSKDGEMLIKTQMAGIADQSIPLELSLHILPGSSCDYYYKENRLNIPDYMPLVLYIAADRIGPQTNLPLRTNVYGITLSSEKDHSEYVGAKGEYTLDVLSRYINHANVPEYLQMNRDKEQQLSGLIVNINGWLNEISPGFTLDIDTMKEADVGRLVFAKKRSHNVGFGLSYSLPIISSCLLLAALISEKAKTGETWYAPTLLIENPEAHLHPRGQTVMGRFLAKAASCGVQCIVETHSDHLFDGVRLSVKEDDLSPDDVIAHYFEYDLKKEESEVTPILIDKYGMCDEWPEGFFDENAKNLMSLV